jgi:hypothetical protein
MCCQRYRLLRVDPAIARLIDRCSGPPRWQRGSARLIRELAVKEKIFVGAAQLIHLVLLRVGVSGCAARRMEIARFDSVMI